MRKHAAILTAAILALCTPAKAAGGVDSLFFDARGTFHQEINNGTYGSRLQADYLNFHVFGHITDNVSFRIRQRLNTWIDEQNPFRATDWMCINWQATDRWAFSAGKTAIMIGGYEYDAPPIDVYFYSRFCNDIQQAFAFSVNATYTMRDGQDFTFQISNSPLTPGFSDTYSFNFAWLGHFAPWWKTIWSYNLVEDSIHRKINYIALGNHWTFGNMALDLDLMDRASLSQRNLFSDYTLITKLIWNTGKWNWCAKAGYESNAAENVDADGRPYDVIIAPGTRYLYGGVGIEYFPLGDKRIRLHATAFRDNYAKVSNFQMGVTWRFDLIRRK